ncbi:hypothetical protein [Legionella oakridgensis]|uniref:hypothetical protein n=1 Tax=Legionella oakridgensis TaxID=29423 RepID=UPI0003DE4082|nr:hypothetical protein [Legionella oakridgensis]ETO93651.1 hypothetical protein LOR_100c25670 [Legionella oakridgensis RV-2-2007]
MIDNDVMHAIILLAEKSYHERSKPEPFAAKAAAMAATEAAATFSMEASSASAFVAVEHVLTLAQYAAELSLLSIKQQEAGKTYYPASKSASKTEEEVEIAAAFQEISDSLKEIPFGENAHSLYHRFFNDKTSKKHQQALLAASSTWLHVYACARAAFIFASAVASRYSDEQREQVFKQTITNRLSADLLGEYIEPGFLVEIITSPATKAIAMILLFAGLVALSIGTMGLAVPAIGTAAAIGVSNACLIGVGFGVTAIGGACMVGRFFTQRQQAADNKKSHDAMQAINAYEDFQPKMNL